MMGVLVFNSNETRVNGMASCRFFTARLLISCIAILSVSISSSFGLIDTKKGIKIHPGAVFALSTHAPIHNALSLGNESCLILDSDLCLSSKCSLVIGEKPGDTASLDGQENTIFMRGSLIIPADRKLHIVSDLIIDGGLNALLFETDSSALSIAEGKTLTIKNMVINGLTGGLQIQGPGKLVLQNVTLNLGPGAVWLFQMESPELVIQDMVIVQGGGEFVFASTKDLIINRFSMFTIDHETTFTYQTDDLVRTHIVMVDGTSKLYFNGSVFHACANEKNSGAQLTKGTIILNNRVMLANDYNTDVMKSIEWGDGTIAHDVLVKVLGGARIDIEGYVCYSPGPGLKIA